MSRLYALTSGVLLAWVYWDHMRGIADFWDYVFIVAGVVGAISAIRWCRS